MKDFGLEIWGDKNFVIQNDTININHANQPSLLEITEEIREKGYKGPLLLRFPHLIKKQISTLFDTFDKAKKEFLKVAIEFNKAHPNMGAMILECTGMQPFARAIQREIDIPIFSWGTLLDYAYSVAVHRDYYGHV